MIATASTSDLTRDLLRLAPEGLVALAALWPLAARLASARPGRIARLIPAIFGVVACALLGASWPTVAERFGGGMLADDPLAAFGRMAVAVGLVITLFALTNDGGADDAGDRTVLLGGAALGMMLMCSSAHWIMAIIAFEMASLPAYALAGFRKGSNKSAEAALKFALFGASSSAAMIYGLSLLVAAHGSATFENLGAGVAQELASGQPTPLSLAGAVLVLGGLLFKLALVPYHFWSPDAYQGARAEVAGFLSVGAKAGALVMLGRQADSMFDRVSPEMRPGLALGFGGALWLAGGISCLWGNLAALRQNDLQRTAGVFVGGPGGVFGVAARPARPGRAGVGVGLPRGVFAHEPRGVPRFGDVARPPRHPYHATGGGGGAT